MLRHHRRRLATPNNGATVALSPSAFIPARRRGPPYHQLALHQHPAPRSCQPGGLRYRPSSYRRLYKPRRRAPAPGGVSALWVPPLPAPWHRLTETHQPRPPQTLGLLHLQAYRRKAIGPQHRRRSAPKPECMARLSSGTPRHFLTNAEPRRADTARTYTIAATESQTAAPTPSMP